MTNFKYILFIILLSACNKQETAPCDYISDYYPLIYEAEYEYWSENYEKSFGLYQEAFKNCEPKNTPFFNELSKIAELAARLNKKDLAIEFIEKAIQDGGNIQTFIDDTIYDDVLATEKGNALISNYDQLRETYLETIDIELRNEIQAMMQKDQFYRGNHERYKENSNKQDSIDDVNTARLIAIFEEIGYPDDQIVGHMNIDFVPTDISGILLHTEDSIRMNYFVPKLKEFISQGKAEPRILGNIIDQYHLYNDKPQIYGTYQSQDTYYASMIENRELINKNRLSIGLPTLELNEKLDSIKCVKRPHIMPQSCEKLFKYLSKN
ncbi:MAG: hypothetical protein WDZ45_04710 [Flavobacteriaceae bacterium]